MKLEITDQQASILVAALDCYSRLQMGQLWAIADALEGCTRKDGTPIYDRWDVRERWTDPMATDVFGFQPGSSWAIFSRQVPESGRIAYDMQRVIRGDETVTIKASPTTPLPIILT